MGRPELDLDALEAKARAATKGPWSCVWTTEYGEMNTVLSRYPEGVDGGTGEWVVRFDDDYGTDSGANGEFIAACDPDTILQLIARLRLAAEVAGMSLAALHELAATPSDTHPPVGEG